MPRTLGEALGALIFAAVIIALVVTTAQALGKL